MLLQIYFLKAQALNTFSFRPKKVLGSTVIIYLLITIHSSYLILENLMLIIDSVFDNIKDNIFNINNISEGELYNSQQGGNNSGGQDPRPDGRGELDTDSRKRKRSDSNDFDLWDEKDENINNNLKEFIKLKKSIERDTSKSSKYDPAEIIKQLKDKWEPVFKKNGYTDEEINKMPSDKEISEHIKNKLHALLDESWKQQRTGNIMKDKTNLFESKKLTPQEHEYICDKVFKLYEDKAIKKNTTRWLKYKHLYDNIKGKRPFREYHGNISEHLMNQLFDNWRRTSWKLKK